MSRNNSFQGLLPCFGYGLWVCSFDVLHHLGSSLVPSVRLITLAEAEKEAPWLVFNIAIRRDIASRSH